jgi:monoamine oxidase
MLETGDLKFKDSSWFNVITEKVYPTVGDHIRLNSVVREINYQDDKVLVTTENKTVFEADKVLVTVPIKILQRDTIKFSPDLPSAKMNAINSQKMVPGLKVFIEFKERFYPDATLCGTVWQYVVGMGHKDCTYYDASYGKDTKRHILGLLAIADDTKKYYPQISSGQKMDKKAYDAKIIENVLAELDKMFEGKASQFYVKGLVQDWTAEPYIQGAYSGLQLMDFNADSLTSPVDNKVFFAGEAISPSGMRRVAVHAAVESAYLAVKQILAT